MAQVIHITMRPTSGPATRTRGALHFDRLSVVSPPGLTELCFISSDVMKSSWPCSTNTPVGILTLALLWLQSNSNSFGHQKEFPLHFECP